MKASSACLKDRIPVKDGIMGRASCGRGHVQGQHPDNHFCTSLSQTAAASDHWNWQTHLPDRILHMHVLGRRCNWFSDCTLRSLTAELIAVVLDPDRHRSFFLFLYSAYRLRRKTECQSKTFILTKLHTNR